MRIRAKKILSLLLSAIILAGGIISVFAYTTGDDYPAEYKNAAKDSTFDKWGFPNRECTSFVCWCLESRNDIAVTNFSVDGKSITAGKYPNFMLGEAQNWGAAFSGMGYTVDSVPAVGAVLWTSNGTSGHVAWVKSIDGDRITSEEYNNSYATKLVKGVEAKGEYGSQTRTLSEWLSSGYKFIHIKDIGAPQNIDVPSSPSTDGNEENVWKLILDFILSIIKLIANLIKTYM